MPALKPDAVRGAKPAGKKPHKPVTFEQRFVEYAILLTLLLAALPCAAGFLMSRPDFVFVGATYNVDDTAVYYSWVRQAADGHFFIHNLFTTDPQNPIQFNLLMLAIGVLVRLTHIPIPVILFVVRIVAGGFLLSLIYRLYKLLAPVSVTVRLCAFGFTCLGSGFGWMFWPRWADKNLGALPVDTWQPEAFTFQSIEFSALFAASTILIVSIIYLLTMAQRSGQMRYAVGAGVCALVLGNVHSYDILHVGGAWLLFLIVTNFVERRFDRAAWGQAVICGLMAVPSTLYQLHMYNVDPAFHQRVLNPTRSGNPIWYVLGYGVMLLLAIGAAAHWVTTRFADAATYLADRRAALLPICWFCAAIMLSYAPVDFQRKMVMVAYFPLFVIGGCFVCMLVE